MTDTPTQRTFWTTAKVRVQDLKSTDVAWHNGRWLWVADTYREETEIIGEYGDPGADEQPPWVRQIIAKLDNASEQQRLVRFLDDVASTAGEIEDLWVLFVDYDLIEIQVPQG